MLKSIDYRLANSESGCAVYYIDCRNNRCVFSGITYPGSSINYTEDIISAICEKERIQARSIDFFDLQTCLGYKKNPGKLSYDKVHLKLGENGISVAFWEPTSVPEDIIRIFLDLIQGRQPIKA